MQSTANQLLFALKTRGPAKTRVLADQLGITRQAVRDHLERLAAAGLAEHVTAPDGVGRPRQTWSLTAAGHARFPDTHAQMTVELIAAIRGEFGEAGLDRLVARRAAAMATHYEAALSDADGLAARVEQLAALRSAEGYMAEVTPRPDGSFVLAENHCPICAAAAACQGFCRVEQALFTRLLAPARVERTEYLLEGSRRCAYLVTRPAPEGTRRARDGRISAARTVSRSPPG